MQLSKHFSLEDLTTTSTGLTNTPTVFAQSNLRELALLLDQIYEQIGPFRVSSAYRSGEVNDAVGGAENSFHTQGKAADLIPLNDTPRNFFIKILKSPLFAAVGELIDESSSRGIVHVTTPSFTKRSVAMYASGESYITYSSGEVAAMRGGEVPSSDMTLYWVALLLAAAGFVAFITIKSRK